MVLGFLEGSEPLIQPTQLGLDQSLAEVCHYRMFGPGKASSTFILKKGGTQYLLSDKFWQKSIFSLGWNCIFREGAKNILRVGGPSFLARGGTHFITFRGVHMNL